MTFEDSVIALKKHAEALNSSSDQLRSVLLQIEASINSHNAGVSAEVTINGIKLAYTRHQKKWQLVIIEGDKTWSIKDAPRRWCEDVIPSIPDLIEALIKNIVELIPRVKEAVKTSHEILEQIKETVK
jgi:hypothetical protein